MPDSSTLPVDAILTRLGVEGPVSTDLQGLRKVYRAWCLSVPFDNSVKVQTLTQDPNAAMPILDPAEFFESWLSNGTGGTCWAHGNALYSFLKALGFDVHRAAASMYDFGQPNHATAIVNFEDGSRWIVDNSLLTMEPLNIEPASPSQLSEGVHYAEVEYDGDTLYVHGTAPPMPHIFFRLLEPEVPESFYEERYEASRGFSPFNERIHICRKTEESIWAMRGGNLFHVTVEGIQHQPLESEGIKRHLIETFGMSPDYVEQWAASGAMESSLKSESAMPDLPVRIPPSKQGM